MMVKLTKGKRISEPIFVIVYPSGVSFINVLCTPFLYVSALHSFSLATFWLWHKYKSTFVQKNARKKTLLKLTAGCRSKLQAKKDRQTFASAFTLRSSCKVKFQEHVGKTMFYIYWRILCIKLHNRSNNMVSIVFSQCNLWPPLSSCFFSNKTLLFLSQITQKF